MDLLETRPGVLAAASHQDYMGRGGVESLAMMTWLSMRMALGSDAAPLTRIPRCHWAPMLIGHGLQTLGIPH